MNFNTRLILAFVAPAVLFVASLGGSIWALVQTQQEFDQYIQTEQAMANSVREMYAQGLQMGQALRNIVLDPANPKAYDNLQAARSAFDDAHQATLQSARGTPVEPALASLVALRGAQAQAQDKVLALVKTDAAQAIEVLNRELKVMDSTAITFCRDNNLPIVVFNLLERGNVMSILKGNEIGTLVG